MACVAPEHSTTCCGVGLHAAGAPQIVRHGGARSGQSLRVDVSERVRADLGEPLAQRPQPRGAGKAAEIR